ncbi:hypothetical protein Q3G72_008090 [Acer saccharum]|nr:hypothetical protein Q3G72_008090 [Acer saccharum]
MGMSVATPADLADITSHVSKSGLRAGAYISAGSTACAGPFDLPGSLAFLSSVATSSSIRRCYSNCRAFAFHVRDFSLSSILNVQSSTED